jgi:hypothetical protein
MTVLGITRPGYGAAGDGKQGPDAVKECISDAIRNAAMRFGVALDLWAKTDLAGAQDDTQSSETKVEQPASVFSLCFPMNRPQAKKALIAYLDESLADEEISKTEASKIWNQAKKATEQASIGQPEWTEICNLADEHLNEFFKQVQTV